MANSLTALSPTYWSRNIAAKLYKRTQFRNLASFAEQASLKNGEYVDRPYRANVVVENYTKGTALTAQDISATSDKLQVNVFKAALVYVDNIDKIQNSYSAANAYIDEISKRLAISIDGRFFYEVVNAADTIDDGDLGGTASRGFTLTVDNIDNMFAKTKRKLDVNNVDQEGRFFALSPQMYDVLWQRVGGKQSMLGDKTSESGNVGEYAGFKLYMTNNLTGSARWTPGDALTPDASDTITINGVVFTWQTTIGSTAGNVLAVTDMPTSIDNIVAFINDPGTTSANQVALSTANQRTVQDWVAVDGTTYFEVRVKGGSYLTVSSSDVADVWTDNVQLQRALAGAKGSIDVVIQKEPSVEMDSTVSAGKSGVNILPMTVFGVKTFNKGTSEILDIWVRSDAY